LITIETILLIVGGYLAGSIPTGVVLSRLFSARDIRAEGSGNIGATNVFRVLGLKLGVLTLLGDVLKGVLPVLAARTLLAHDAGVAWVAFFTFCGHLFPVFLTFRGGKGVATALGVFLVISPAMVACAAALFLGVVLKWKYVSLGSLTASLAMPFLLGAAGYSLPFVILSLATACLIFYRHKDNIQRLRAGSEKKMRGG
jgi:glycerol-3-phosphate acyltransferase PlsY